MTQATRYVLDTNVLSAPRIRGHNRQVEVWAPSVPAADQFVTALTMAEIERGVVVKERSGPPQGEILRRWFEERVLPAFAGRVLPFDLDAARLLATYRVPEPVRPELVARKHASGVSPASRCAGDCWTVGR